MRTLSDTTALWHPFADMAVVKDHELVIARGDGARVWDEQGREYVDARAGLWYCAVGHGRTEIAEAAAAQGFVPGILSPTEVLVLAPGVTGRRAALTRLQHALAAQKNVNVRDVDVLFLFGLDVAALYVGGDGVAVLRGAVFDGLERLAAEAEVYRVDMATLAFAWVLASVDGAVCGPNRASHLDPVLAARGLHLTPDDVNRIGGFFA